MLYNKNMDTKKKCFKSIVLFFIYALLTVNAFGSESEFFDPENLRFGQVTCKEDKTIKGYHFLPGLYRYIGIKKMSGYGIDQPPSSYDNFLKLTEKIQTQDELIFVEKFKTIGDTIYGKATNQKWYLIYSKAPYVNPIVSTEAQFKELSESFKNYQTLKNKNETLNTDYKKLNKDYEILKWYGLISIGILILVLIVILVYTLTSKDSNIPKKFKVKDQVKVRNTNQQKWRMGEVVQPLMVRVDGWEKAHTWNYVEKVADDTERQHEEGDDVSNEDSLLCSSMSISLEKSSTNISSSKDSLLYSSMSTILEKSPTNEINSGSLQTMESNTDAPETNTI